MTDEDSFSELLSIEPTAEGEAPIFTLDPVAASIALHDPKISDKLATYLDRQSRLVGIQTEHLHEQRTLTLTSMNLRTIWERQRLALQSSLVLLMLCVACIIGTLVWQAVEARGVVIDPLAMPPDLVAKGMSGEVAAASLLDELERIQTDTRSDEPQPEMSRAWTERIRVAIPQTGVTIGDIERLLRGMFGREIHIGGNIFERRDGKIVLTVRGLGVPARSFIGNEDAPSESMRLAAEYVYGQAQPTAFGEYLLQSRRLQELSEFCQGALHAANDRDRARLEWLWGMALARQGALSDAEPKLHAALRGEPHLWRAWHSLALVEEVLHGYEAALGVYAQMHAVAAEAPANEQPDAVLKIEEFRARGDFSAAVAAFIVWDRNSGGGYFFNTIEPALAELEADRHDWVSADEWLDRAPPQHQALPAIRNLVRGLQLIDDDPVAAAAALLEAQAITAADTSDRLNAIRDQAPCYRALALARAGQRLEAIAAMELGWAYGLCPSLRADAWEALGDHEAADSAYRVAIERSPSTPFAYAHRGAALLARGDVTDSLKDFAAAAARGPHWADP